MGTGRASSATPTDARTIRPQDARGSTEKDPSADTDGGFGVKPRTVESNRTQEAAESQDITG